MKNKLEIAKIIVWIAFICYTFTLFISDFKHTHMFPNIKGELESSYVNYDFQLKFLAYVLIFFPLLIQTFLRHNLFSIILAIILPLIALGSYYWLSYAFQEDGYFLFDGTTYAGYVPHIGFYFSIGSIVLLLIAGVFKALAPIETIKKSQQGLIDDLNN